MGNLIAVLLLWALSGPGALAQFVGPTAQWKVGTVAQAHTAHAGAYLAVTGQIVAHQGGDYYTFKDPTGEISVEIDDRLWKGRTVGPQTKLKLLAEVDGGAEGRYLWVKSLEILEGQPAQQGGLATPPAPRPSPATISLQQAKSIALALHPGATLVQGELARKGPGRSGPAVWDMKLSNGMAVYVDATTGAVLEQEPWHRR